MFCEFEIIKAGNEYTYRCKKCKRQYKLPFFSDNLIAECIDSRPGKIRTITNYAKAGFQHAITGFKKTPQDVKELRQSICNKCRHLHTATNTCLYCNCPIQDKSSWKEQSCPVGKWPMSSSLLYRADAKDKDIKINLENFYKNQTAFFIGCGPSLNNIDLSIFSRNRGLFTFAVNNIAAKDIKPNFWASADNPTSFHENIWRDPTITKFVRRENYFKPMRTEEWVRNMPSVFYFDINQDFDENTFLTEPTVNFGNEKNTYDTLGNKGGRCVMLMSIRLLYYLGFRQIYLLGCDYYMDNKQPYAFEQGKHIGGCNTNNEKFRIINERFIRLRPKLEEQKCIIKNCNPNSKLTAFDYESLDIAIQKASKGFVEKPDLTNLYGNA